WRGRRLFFIGSRAETSDAGNGRRRPPEEEGRARDRAGSRAALDQGAAGTHRAPQRRDRSAAGDDRQQAGLAQRGRSVLQEVGDAPPACCGGGRAGWGGRGNGTGRFGGDELFKILRPCQAFMIITGCFHLLGIEWPLSTLFDASLFRLRAAGYGGSFFVVCPIFGRRKCLFAVRSRSCSALPLGNYVQRFVRRVLDRRRRLRDGSSLARGWRKSKNVRVA